MIEPHVDGLLAQARRFIEQGKLEEALKAYGEVIERRPERWEGHMGVAHVAYSQGNYPLLFRHLPAAIHANGECLPAYEIMADLGSRGGMGDVAIQWLEHGASHLPGEPLIFEWLTYLYAQEGRDTDLINCLGHYGRLRGKSASEAAILFSRDPKVPEDIRARIALAGRYG